jgi:3-oxoacyl-[acyl-carrier-protein] synthase-3
MMPFVVNRYGRIVFPFNFFPELDFSIFETLEQFAAVIKRDFEDAVREGVIDRPMRIFAPAFGAGAVAGYVVARLDPAIVAV